MKKRRYDCSGWLFCLLVIVAILEGFTGLLDVTGRDVSQMGTEFGWKAYLVAFVAALPLAFWINADSEK